MDAELLFEFDYKKLNWNSKNVYKLLTIKAKFVIFEKALWTR